MTDIHDHTHDAASMPDDDPDATIVAEHDSGRTRSRRARGSSERLGPRFTPQERNEVDAAAASVGVSAARFCAEAAVAAARGVPVSLAAGQEREALARLQRQLFEARTAVVRFGTNVNQAVAALNASGAAPDWLARAVRLCARSVQRLDDVVAEVDRRLR